MRNQRADADNRVVNVLWEFVAKFSANFVIALALVTFRRSEIPRGRVLFQCPIPARGACQALGGYCSIRRFFMIRS
jgi:hypothetical protein